MAVGGLLPITNTNVIHIEAKLNNVATGITNCITSWDINFDSAVSLDDTTLTLGPVYGQPHNFNKYQENGQYWAQTRYNNMTEGNADGTVRGQGITPYYTIEAGTNKLFGYTTSALGDALVIPSPSSTTDEWFTLCYGRADNSSEQLPIPTTATVLVSPKDGSYDASDITSVSITNIPSA